MKSKFIFILLAVLVFSTLLYCGYLLINSHRVAFYLIEGITICSIILFVFLYQRLIKPYHILIDSIDMIKGQDFASRLRPVSNNEANQLIDIFNQMMEKLKDERVSVREKNHFLDLLVEASPQGVIVLNYDYYITTANPAALRFLELDNIHPILNKKLEETEIDFCIALASLENGKDKIIRGRGATQYKCTLSSFIDRGFSHPFILIEELTHEFLAVEKKSYENVIRMMSHEVNNSIGAINATLSVVSDIALADKKLEDILPAVNASATRCTRLGEFVSRFGQVVKTPEPHLTWVNISELIRTVNMLVYAECRRRAIVVELQLPHKDLFAQIDGIQFEHVLLNIIKNAYEAIHENGIIKIGVKDSPITITVENDGPALSDEVKQNIFTPFYTTKSKGQGVGLMLTREVLVSHNCKFDFYSKGGWTIFNIIIP